MMHATVLCLLVGTLAGGATPKQEHSEQVAYELMIATQARDPSAYPLLEEVLRDMSDQTYIYFRDARLKAFEYIEATEQKRALPLLKEVASLPPPVGESLEAILDAIAIDGALGALIALGDEEAGELSRRHIFGHPAVQSGALRHLAALKMWNATPEVEDLFCTIEATGDLHVQIESAAAFLASSPETTDQVCPCFNRIREAFAEKFARARSEGNPLFMFYERLDASMRALDDRFGCTTRRPERGA